MIPALQMRKLRLRGMRPLAHSHTAGLRQTQEANLVRPILKATPPVKAYYYHYECAELLELEESLVNFKSVHIYCCCCCY